MQIVENISIEEKVHPIDLHSLFGISKVLQTSNDEIEMCILDEVFDK